MLKHAASDPGVTKVDRFCRLPLFEHLAKRDIKHLLDESSIIELDAGDVLVQEGEPATAAFFIMEGELDVLRRVGGRDIHIATRPANEMIGEMGLLIGTPRTATVRARASTKVLEISYERLHETLLSNPEGMFLLLRTVVARLKHTETSLVQSQKLAALGNLAAGLAHELNNPAAALVRSASQLQDTMIEWETQAERLGRLDLNPEECSYLSQLRDKLLMGAPRTRYANDLARSDEEQAVHDRLVTLGVTDAWLLAASLIDANVISDDLGIIEERIASQHLDPVLHWISAGQRVFLILNELRGSGRAISDIVAGVRSYTHLDQAPVQDVDIRDGIDQTLALLGHKLRGIDLRRNYAPELPKITAFASELNQVWTNLIDNAADALDGHGQLSIRISSEREFVVIEIEDNGRGIPAEVQQHLFEPFYTTKPVGRGTGLGLSITRNIVQKHHGTIDITTSSDGTCFTVCLPIEWRRHQG